MAAAKRPKLKLLHQPPSEGSEATASSGRYGIGKAAGVKKSGSLKFSITRRLSEERGGYGCDGAGSRSSKTPASPSKWLMPDFSEAGMGSSSLADCQLWCDGYAPASRDELCLHKKKVDELEDWLRGIDRPRRDSHAEAAARLLFLHGPCGAGKSTAIRVLCAALRLELACLDNELDGGGGGAGGSGENALQALLRLGRFGDAQIILWDEPSLVAGSGSSGTNANNNTNNNSSSSAFGSDPLRSVLDQFRVRCPNACLILVTCNERLLPRDWLEDRWATIVQVNPVARTQLIRCLNALLTRRCLRPASYKALVDSIADSSDGDIRAAVSGLQFSLQFARQASYTTAASSGSKSSGQAVMLFRDTPYQLFHAVGKLLYAKPPVSEQPEAVSERSSLPEELLVAFLQSNAASHFAPGAVEPLARLADAFAFADRLCAAWSTEADAKAHAVSLASRAVVRHLQGANRAPNQFRPIRKPIKLPPPTSRKVNGADVFYAPACLRQRMAASRSSLEAGGSVGQESGGRGGGVRFVICSERDAKLEATIVDSD